MLQFNKLRYNLIKYNHNIIIYNTIKYYFTYNTIQYEGEDGDSILMVEYKKFYMIIPNHVIK